MEKEYLEAFFKNHTKIRLNLKDKRVYTGYIIKLTDNSLVFKDKYDHELPFDLEVIAYIDVVDGGKDDTKN